MVLYFFAELPVLNQEHKNVAAANRALTRAQLARQILHSKENTVATNKSKKDTFVLEDIDSTCEKSPNTTVETLCGPDVENGGQLLVSDDSKITAGNSKQEIKEGNEKTMLRETDFTGSMNDTCKIVLASKPRSSVSVRPGIGLGLGLELGLGLGLGLELGLSLGLVIMLGLG